VRLVALALALLAACTPSGPGTEPTTSDPPAAGPIAGPTVTPPPRVTLPVVASGPRGAVDGMRLAADRTGIGLEVVEAGGDPTGTLREVVATEPPAVLVVDEPAAVTAARPEMESAGVPVVLVGGDLYSFRRLFRYAFQVSVPLRWQARVLAHYLVGDRGHPAIALASPEARGVFVAALAEEGASPAPSAVGADAVLGTRREPIEGAQLALTADALMEGETLPPGTVACAPYTWVGWAEPIPRVARFRERFANRFGREPVTSEQEGYEAVRALAEALERTRFRGGDTLVRALESFRDETYSSTPIRLGPDDHVLAEQSHLGLFAVAAPGRGAPDEDLEPVPWRPVMRTFTTNGKRVNLTDRDVRVFFPEWRPPAPRPNYWRSRYGIVTRPEDPLH
jgi:hypothetical protein